MNYKTNITIKERKSRKNYICDITGNKILYGEFYKVAEVIPSYYGKWIVKNKKVFRFIKECSNNDIKEFIRNEFCLVTYDDSEYECSYSDIN